MKEEEKGNLPACAAEFINLVIKKMRYRKKIRKDVQAELTNHFEDELRDCKDEKQREQKAQQIIEQFGDVKILGVLLRRAKRRCRPLWRTVVARSFQALAVLILCFILYTVWFMVGRPAPKTDYLELINAKAKPDVLEGENAWTYLEKAISVFTEPNNILKESEFYKDKDQPKYRYFYGLTNEQKNLVIDWLSRNKEALELFSTASQQHYFYRKAEYDPNDSQKWLWGTPLLHFKPIREMTYAKIWQSRMDVNSGQVQQGIDNCVEIVRLGAFLPGDMKTIVEQLVGILISRIGCLELLNIMNTAELSADQLRKLQQKLLDIYPDGYPEVNMEMERYFFLDTVQHSFTEGGPGGGHMIPKKMIVFEVLCGSGGYDDTYTDIAKATFGSMAHVGRDKTIAKGKEMYDYADYVLTLTPYQRHIKETGFDKHFLRLYSSKRYFFICMMSPAMDKVSDIRFEGKVLYEALLTVISLQRYKLEKGEYPENLKILVDNGYIKQIPDDPYSDKPLVYRKEKNSFTLYSLGHNFVDDAGEHGTKDDKFKINADNGDTVFWPAWE